jgi:hypothetical protein
VQNLNFSYNDLASNAIDQEGTMRAYEVAEEKRKKRSMPGPTGGSSSGAPLKYRMVYTARGTATPTTVVLEKVLAAATVQPHTCHSIVARSS